jgi:long-chain fatty acid transport protein
MRSLKTIIAVLLLLPALALANGYDVPNVAPRDLSMSGSAVAAQNDAGAAYAMPAALARLPGYNLSLNASVLVFNTEWTDITGGTYAPSPAKTNFKPVPPVAMFGSYGFEGSGRKFGIGAGFNVPGGGNVFWDDNWAGRGRIITVDRKIYAGYLSGGYQVFEPLRIGASAIYYYGVEYLKQGVQPVTGAYGELATQGGALSFGLSAEYRPSPAVPLTLAIDFKYQGKMNLKGDGHFSVPGSLEPGVQDQGVTHELTYPSVLNVAAAFQVSKPLLLTLGFTYNFYDVYKSDVFAGDAGLVIEVPRNYANGYTYRVGAEFEATDRLVVRAGVLRDISGLDPNHYSPTLPDASTWAVSAGLGYKVTPAWVVNGAYFRGFMDKVTSPVGSGELPGDYQSSVWIASLGVTWQPGAVAAAKAQAPAPAAEPAAR